jgi:hypothetical protein
MYHKHKVSFKVKLAGLISVLCLLSIASFAQIKVSGKVVDHVGKAIISATVVFKNAKSQNSFLTDTGGRFTATLSEPASYQIKVTATGNYYPKSINRRVADRRDRWYQCQEILWQLFFFRYQNIQLE